MTFDPTLEPWYPAATPSGTGGTGTGGMLAPSWGDVESMIDEKLSDALLFPTAVVSSSTPSAQTRAFAYFIA